MITRRESTGLLNVFISVIPLFGNVLVSMALCETKPAENIDFKLFKDNMFDSIGY